MILTVPYSYDVHGFEGLRRTESSHKAAGTVDVMIEELSSDQAPVAAELTIREPFSRKDDPKGTVAIRFIEGRGLFAPVSQTDFTPRPTLDAEAFAEAVSRHEKEGNPFARYARYIPPEGKEGPRFNPRKRISDNRDQVLEEIHGVASDIVVVDGIPHAPCEEPVLKLSRKDVPERLGGKWLLNCVRLFTGGERLAYYDSGPDEVFRLDEWPRIKSELREIADEHRTKIDLPDDAPDVVLHLCHAFRAETESMALVEVARSVYRDLLFHIKNSAGMNFNEDRSSWRRGTNHEIVAPGIVKAWQALGEALHGDRLDEDSLDRIIQAIETHHVEAAPPRETDANGHDRFVGKWARALRAVDRFRNRPSHVRSASLDSDDIEALDDLGRTAAI